MKSAPLKIIVVVLGAMGLSTIGIFASDSIRGVDGNLAQLIGAGEKSECPENTVLLSGGDFRICVDMYEESPSSRCPHTILQNTLASEENLHTSDCNPVSAKDAIPWTYISATQAQQACAKVGKRLPLPSEWYRLALGAETEQCVTQATGAQKTGSVACVSSSGVYDAVGNVWEWVDAQVTNNTYDGRALPESGYVSAVDMSGVALQSSTTASTLYGSDYVWTKKEGVFGVIRGGFYGSGSDAGLYTVNTSVPTDFATQGVGFRCVKDVG